MTTAKPMDAASVRERILSGNEVAILDLRELGVFGDGHLLFAVNLPLSHLETRIDDMVPRKSTPIILCAGGKNDQHLVELGAKRLKAFGYKNVSALDGGLKAWKDAGFEVFSGVNVPSKAFGEFVEHTYDTPRIPPQELKAMMDRGEKMIVLDSRPMSEYHKMNIPTGIDCPGAELAYRVHDLVPDPDTTVVVNCAGRTRSIIGAQSLINAGIPNKVVALENGTMGWHLAGYKLEYGKSRQFDGLSDAGEKKAKKVASRVAKRFGVKTCTHADLAKWQANPRRTTYLLDVRNPDEFKAGHLPGARHAPGGQLVQAWDRYIATLGARIVLTCDDGVRATMTAHWLVQMGWTDVHVLKNPLKGQGLLVGPHQPLVYGLGELETDEIDAAMLQKRMKKGDTVVIDLADSLTYRDGHIPGAWFAVRARLRSSLKKIPKADLTVVTSPDGLLARFAAAEIQALGRKDVAVLAGGTASWTDAGKKLETGFTNMADKTNDVWYRPYDMDDAQEGAMKQYLSWEINLVNQLERDGTTRFVKFTEA